MMTRFKKMIRTRKHCGTLIRKIVKNNFLVLSYSISDMTCRLLLLWVTIKDYSVNIKLNLSFLMITSKIAARAHEQLNNPTFLIMFTIHQRVINFNQPRFFVKSEVLVMSRLGRHNVPQFVPNIFPFPWSTIPTERVYDNINFGNYFSFRHDLEILPTGMFRRYCTLCDINRFVLLVRAKLGCPGWFLWNKLDVM